MCYFHVIHNPQGTPLWQKESEWRDVKIKVMGDKPWPGSTATGHRFHLLWPGESHFSVLNDFWTWIFWGNEVTQRYIVSCLMIVWCILLCWCPYLFSSRVPHRPLHLHIIPRNANLEWRKKQTGFRHELLWLFTLRSELKNVIWIRFRTKYESSQYLPVLFYSTTFSSKQMVKDKNVY